MPQKNVLSNSKELLTLSISISHTPWYSNTFDYLGDWLLLPVPAAAGKEKESHTSKSIPHYAGKPLPFILQSGNRNNTMRLA